MSFILVVLQLYLVFLHHLFLLLVLIHNVDMCEATGGYGFKICSKRSRRWAEVSATFEMHIHA